MVYMPPVAGIVDIGEPVGLRRHVLEFLELPSAQNRSVGRADAGGSLWGPYIRCSCPYYSVKNMFFRLREEG